jgi:hypothetical protein
VYDSIVNSQVAKSIGGGELARSCGAVILTAAAMVGFLSSST